MSAVWRACASSIFAVFATCRACACSISAIWTEWRDWFSATVCRVWVISSRVILCRSFLVLRSHPVLLNPVVIAHYLVKRRFSLHGFNQHVYDVGRLKGILFLVKH